MEAVAQIPVIFVYSAQCLYFLKYAITFNNICLKFLCLVCIKTSVIVCVK